MRQMFKVRILRPKCRGKRARSGMTPNQVVDLAVTCLKEAVELINRPTAKVGHNRARRILASAARADEMNHREVEVLTHA
jgi:hypothetical protein